MNINNSTNTDTRGATVARAGNGALAGNSPRKGKLSLGRTLGRTLGRALFLAAAGALAWVPNESRGGEYWWDFDSINLAYVSATGIPYIENFIDWGDSVYSSNDHTQIRTRVSRADITAMIQGTVIVNDRQVASPLLLQDDYGTMICFISVPAGLSSSSANASLVLRENGNLNTYEYPAGTQTVSHYQGSAGISARNFTLNGTSVTSNGNTANRVLKKAGHTFTAGPDGKGIYLSGAVTDELQLSKDKVTFLDNVASGSSAGSHDFKAPISGDGHLGIVASHATNKTITLSHANNTFKGATVVYEGTLKGGAADIIKNSQLLWLQGGTAFDTGAFNQTLNTIYAPDTNTTITIASGKTLTVNLSKGTIGSGTNLQSVANSVFAGTLTGSGALVLQKKSGAAEGVLELRGTNTGFTGSIEVKAGSELKISSVSNLNATSATRTLTGGTVTFTAAGTYDAPWTIGSGGGTFNVDSGIVSVNSIYGVGTDGTNSGTFTKAGAGTLELTGNSTLTDGTASNDIKVTGGNLTVSGWLGAAGTDYKGTITLSNATTLTFAPRSGQTQSLGKNSTIEPSTGNPTTEVVMSGAGTLVVGGTIASPVTVAAGRVEVNSLGSLKAATTVQSGATVVVKSGGTVEAQLTVESGGMLQGVGTVRNLVMNSGAFIAPGTVAIYNSGGSGYHTRGEIGTITVGTTGSTTDFSGITYKLDVDDRAKSGAYYPSDLIHVGGYARFGTNGANTIDLSDVFANGKDGRTEWTADREYLIMKTEQGFSGTTKADLDGTIFLYRGVAITSSNSQMKASLSIVNGNKNLVLKTGAATSNDLTWVKTGAPNNVWEWNAGSSSRPDWVLTSTFAGARTQQEFLNADTVHFVGISGVASGVKVDSGGVLVGDMFVESGNFTFSEGSITSAPSVRADGTAGTEKLTVAAGAKAQFDSNVNMKNIQVDGEATFNANVVANSANQAVSSDLNIGSSGRVTLGANGKFGDSTTPGTSVRTITIAKGGQLLFVRSASSYSTYGGTLHGAGDIVVAGTFTDQVGAPLILTGQNSGTFTGDIFVMAGGALNIAGDNNLNAPTANRTVSGGKNAVVEFTNTSTLYASPWQIGKDGGAFETNYAGTVRVQSVKGIGSSSDSGTFYKKGGGALELTGNSTLISGTQSNNIEVTQGRLVVSGWFGADGAAYTGKITMGIGAVLELPINSGQTRVFSSTSSIVPTVSGMGTLLKKGDGTLVLGGSVGSTVTVQAGTIVVESGANLSKALNLQAGTLQGTGTISKLTMSAGTTIAPGTPSVHIGGTSTTQANDHIAGTIGTLTVGASGTTTEFAGITYKLDVNDAAPTGGATYSDSDLVNVLGTASFGTGGSTNDAKRNTIDLSDVLVSGPGLSNEWTGGREYLIMHADQGISTGKADLDATFFKYRGVEINNANSRMSASLTVVNNNDLVMKTIINRATDLTWDKVGGTSGEWKAGNNRQDWYVTNKPQQRDAFMNLDTVRFVNNASTNVASNVTVEPNGVVVGDMFVEGGTYTFDGGKIAGFYGQHPDTNAQAGGELRINAGATATFYNEVDMRCITVSGTASFHGDVKTNLTGSDGAVVINEGGRATLENTGRFTTPQVRIDNRGTLTFVRDAGSSYTFDGIIFDIRMNPAVPSVIEKVGEGKLVFTGTHFSSGRTNVHGGSLFIDGSDTSEIHVVGSISHADNNAPGGWYFKPAATLGGTGTVADIHITEQGKVLIEGNGATFAPGVSGSGVLPSGAGIRQVMTVAANGSVKLAKGSVFLMQIVGQGAGNAPATTGVHLENGATITVAGAKLVLDIRNYEVKVGDVFTLVSSVSSSVVTANFQLIDDATGLGVIPNTGIEMKYAGEFKYKLLGDADSIQIQVTQIIPEPRTYCLMGGIVLLGAGLWRRRQRNKRQTATSAAAKAFKG